MDDSNQVTSSASASGSTAHLRINYHSITEATMDAADYADSVLVDASDSNVAAAPVVEVLNPSKPKPGRVPRCHAGAALVALLVV